MSNTSNNTRQVDRGAQKSLSNVSRWCLLAVTVVLLESTAPPPPLCSAFTTTSISKNSPYSITSTSSCLNRRGFVSSVVARQTFSLSVLHATTSCANGKYDPEEEVKRRLARAKEVLAKSKAKLDSKAFAAAAAAAVDKKKRNTSKGAADDNDDAVEADGPPLPFFAAQTKAKDPNRRNSIIKNKDDKTGLVQADGEKMAIMSEAEDWEFRSLLDVFQNELVEDEDVNSAASRQLANRDVVASIWNLRKAMKTEDYLKIFDKKNRFIGEDN